MKHAICSQCKGTNTELEVEEEILGDGDESLHISIWCLDCMTYSPFPIDEDWRDYK